MLLILGGLVEDLSNSRGDNPPACQVTGYLLGILPKLGAGKDTLYCNEMPKLSRLADHQGELL